MDLIYTAVLFVMMFVNVAFIFVGVRLLSLIVGIVTLGIVAQAWGSAVYAEIPFSPNVQLLVGLVAVVSMLVVGVRGKHFGE